jgi:hypothetical protein
LLGQTITNIKYGNIGIIPCKPSQQISVDRWQGTPAREQAKIMMPMQAELYPASDRPASSVSIARRTPAGENFRLMQMETL